MGEYKSSATTELNEALHPDEHDVVKVMVRIGSDQMGYYYFEDSFTGDIYTYVGFETRAANATHPQYEESTQLPVAIQKLIGDYEATRVVTEDGDTLADLELPEVEKDE